MHAYHNLFSSTPVNRKVENQPFQIFKPLDIWKDPVRNDYSEAYFTRKIEFNSHQISPSYELKSWLRLIWIRLI